MEKFTEIAKKEAEKKLEACKEAKIQSWLDTSSALRECMVDALYGKDNPKHRTMLDMAKLRYENASERLDRAQIAYDRLK